MNTFMKRRQNVARIICVILIMATLLSMMAVLAGCGMLKKEPAEPTPGIETTVPTTAPATEAPVETQPTETPTISESESNATTPTVAPTEMPVDDPNIPADQEEIDKAGVPEEPTTAPTETPAKPTETPAEPTPTTVPAIEVPSLQSLIDFNRDKVNLSENYHIAFKFAYNATIEVEGETADIEMLLSVDEKSYEHNKYNENTMQMNYLGTREQESTKTYVIVDEANGICTEYVNSEGEDIWYYTEAFWADGGFDTEEILDTDTLNMEDFDSIVTTIADGYISIRAVAKADSDADTTNELMSSAGFDGIRAVAVYQFRFHEDTHLLEDITVTCDIDMQALQEQMDAEGIKSLNISDFYILMGVNNTPIELPKEIEENAVKLDEDFDYGFEPQPVEPSIHKGWGAYYNSYTDNKGVFKMPYGENNVDCEVTISGAENWFFDNSWSFGTYLAVKDDTLSTDGPAHEIFYGDSDIIVNAESFDRAAAELLEHDFTQEKTSDDIVPIVVGGKQAFYFVSYSSEYRRTINILQDIGFNTYVAIDISTEDTTTDTLKLIEAFLLNINIDNPSWL